MQDTALVFKIVDKARKIIYTESERSESLCRSALKIADKLESSEAEVRCYIGLSQSKLHQNQYDSAMYYVNVATPIAQKASLRSLEVRCLDQKAIVYAYQEKFDKSTDLCFKAIKKGEGIGEEHAMRSKATLGYVFMKLGNLDRSSEYCRKSLAVAQKYNDTIVMLSVLNILGLNEKNTDNPDEALKIFEEGLALAIESKNLQRQSQIYYNMGNILMKKGQIDKGSAYLNKGIEISKVNSSYVANAINFHSLAHTNYDFGNGPAALSAVDSAIHYAELSESFEMIMETYALAGIIEARYGSPRLAYEAMNVAYMFKDSMNIAQQRDESIRTETAFEEEKLRIEDSLERVQQKLELETRDRINAQQLQSRDRLIWIFVIAFALFIVAGYFIIKNNRLIKSQNILVNSQKEEIQLQHTEIRDSIDYAQRIQEAMINKKTEWEKIGKYFIFFRPKDVVSGDFYWAHNKENLSIWVVADCTGHGVPGAFMSMLGFSFLNEIVIERNCTNAAEILDLLRTKIVSALGEKGENQARDGMDVSVCIWDKTKNELQYSGANNPLWIIRHESSDTPENVKRITTIEESALQLLEIAADKIPVGYVDGSSKQFSNKVMPLFEGDVIIQLTDGYADQFGGQDGKKLKYATMKRALLEMQSVQFEQQYEQLAQTFDDWRSDYEQVDDVCVVAVKV
ncbi:MAG: hypothetical protein Crog4KO_26320 [Crocinitomicaceae bacterium]